jgi:hypothetical protein
MTDVEEEIALKEVDVRGLIAFTVVANVVLTPFRYEKGRERFSRRNGRAPSPRELLRCRQGTLIWLPIPLSALFLIVVAAST